MGGNTMGRSIAVSITALPGNSLRARNRANAPPNAMTMNVAMVDEMRLNSNAAST
jgi:hypothetical protein